MNVSFRAKSYKYFWSFNTFEFNLNINKTHLTDAYSK